MCFALPRAVRSGCNSAGRSDQVLVIRDVGGIDWRSSRAGLVRMVLEIGEVRREVRRGGYIGNLDSGYFKSAGTC